MHRVPDGNELERVATQKPSKLADIIVKHWRDNIIHYVIKGGFHDALKSFNTLLGTRTGSLASEMGITHFYSETGYGFGQIHVEFGHCRLIQLRSLSQTSR